MDGHPIRERRHRLPREHYCGEAIVSYTACVAGRQPLFTDRDTVDAFRNLLGRAADECLCDVPIYCFMPDHVHLVLGGRDAESDSWSAMVRFKQYTGRWLAVHRPRVHWQKDFYDHILRDPRELVATLRYVADNPVRKNLVESWSQYPFTGAIGIDLNAVLQEAAWSR